MNEIDDLSAGELQPYDGGGMPTLAPLSPSPDSWGQRTDLLTDREINDYQRQPQGPTLFGSQLPTGTTQQQVDQLLAQLGGSFMHDIGALGYPPAYINSTIQFFTENATKPLQQVTRRHNFNLHGQDDGLGNAFGNMVAQLSGTQKAKQSFVTVAIQWLSKVNQKLSGQQQVPTAHGSAPNSAEGLLGQLSDRDYNRVIEINKHAQANTLNYLAAKYGRYNSQEVMRLANEYLHKLPEREQAHFDQFTTVNGVSWVHMMNTPETVEFLYNAAIGANNIPQDGAGLAREIAEFEAMLKIPSERQKYMRDPQLQARYRQLLTLRDG